MAADLVERISGPADDPSAGRNVATTLAMDALHQVTGGHRARRHAPPVPATPTPPQLLERAAPAAPTCVTVDNSVPDPDTDGEQLLAWAARRGLPEAELTLLRRHYLDNEAAADIARRDGLTAAAVHRRIRRALARLKNAVDADNQLLASI